MNVFKKVFFCIAVILFSTLPFKEAYAESSQNYQSTGEISFYGTYTYPVDPEKRIKVLPVVPEPSQVNTEKSKVTQFPQTGEGRNQSLALIGIIFFMGSMIINCKQLGGNKK